MSTPIAKRATANEPCACCCTGTKGCSETADGMVLCRADVPARPGDWFDLPPSPDANGFHHRRRIGEKHKGQSSHRASPKLLLNGKPVTNGKAHASRDWKAKAEEYAKNLAGERRRELSADLFYSPDALDVLPMVGFNPADYHGPCMTFPEFDAAGRVVGILRRYSKGKGPYGSDKVAMPGGKRGLHIPNGWRERPGAVYVVEGPTDVAAMTVCGLSSVGRPSSSGGGELLAELLRDWPADRQIVVVGENDKKTDGLWPGRDGAVAVAGEITQKLNRPVSIAFPPANDDDPNDRYKDAREWVIDLITSEDESSNREAHARTIVDHLDRNKEAITPNATAPTATPRFEFIDSRAFATGDFRPQWLVKRVMVKGQPGVIAGPAKALKTNSLHFVRRRFGTRNTPSHRTRSQESP